LPNKHAFWTLHASTVNSRGGEPTSNQNPAPVCSLAKNDSRRLPRTSRGTCQNKLDATPSASARSARPVMGHRSDIFDPADPETGSSKHAYRCLRAWARRSCPVPSRCPHSNVEGGNSSILRRSRGGTRRLHRRVRGALKPVRLHVLPAGTSRNSLCSSEVSDVHQCVVERGVYVRDTPSFNAFLRNRCFLLCDGES